MQVNLTLRLTLRWQSSCGAALTQTCLATTKCHKPLLSFMRRCCLHIEVGLARNDQIQSSVVCWMNCQQNKQVTGCTKCYSHVTSPRQTGYSRLSVYRACHMRRESVTWPQIQETIPPFSYHNNNDVRLHLLLYGLCYKCVNHVCKIHKNNK